MIICPSIDYSGVCVSTAGGASPYSTFLDRTYMAPAVSMYEETENGFIPFVLKNWCIVLIGQHSE